MTTPPAAPAHAAGPFPGGVIVKKFSQLPAARAVLQIEGIKQKEHPVVRPSEDNGRVFEMKSRPWGEVPEPAKLEYLSDMVDWTGVSDRDRAHILLKEVDVGKLSGGQRDRLIREAAREEPAKEPARERELEPETE